MPEQSQQFDWTSVFTCAILGILVGCAVGYIAVKLVFGVMNWKFTYIEYDI